MKTLFVVAATVLITGCSGLIQTGSVTRAYETYEEQDYAETLELISLAEKVDDMTPELDAELKYLKAETYAQLGMVERSDALFRSIATKHKDTEHGYLAEKKLKASKQLN